MKKIVGICTAMFAISMIFSFPSFALEGMAIVKSDGKNDARYSYYYDDGSCKKNEWIYIWEAWYYFGDDGATIQNAWAEIDEKWYYFDQWSIMLHDTVTPDGYTVGADGAWLVDVPQVTE